MHICYWLPLFWLVVGCGNHVSLHMYLTSLVVAHAPVNYIDFTVNYFWRLFFCCWPADYCHVCECPESAVHMWSGKCHFGQYLQLAGCFVDRLHFRLFSKAGPAFRLYPSCIINRINHNVFYVYKMPFENASLEYLIPYL